MKIAQLVYNFHAVLPDSSNAIYSTVSGLTDGLVDQGNEVSLFAAGDSITQARLQSVSKSTSHLEMSNDVRKYYYHLLVSECYRQAASFDIIHSHFSLLSSFYAPLVGIPTVMSLHSPIDPAISELLLRFKDNYYISFSLAQRSQLPELNWVGNIYHGIDTDKFAFNPAPQDYFLYVGRITEDKGVHLAIEAAREADVPLVIAGKSYGEEKYWQTHIEKWIDGKHVKYVGVANYENKIKLYQNAKALLFPTQRPEPFGMVMIEAMSCGTPVIGWNNGSVPEVVQDKESGFIVNDVSEMVKAIKSIDTISRQATRARAERLFSIEKMVSGYEKIYARLIESHGRKK